MLADTGSGITGFGDWAEQLIAESTGKNGTGLLPVVVENPDSPGFADAREDATAGGHRPAARGRPAGHRGHARRADPVVGDGDRDRRHGCSGSTRSTSRTSRRRRRPPARCWTRPPADATHAVLCGRSGRGVRAGRPAARGHHARWRRARRVPRHRSRTSATSRCRPTWTGSPTRRRSCCAPSWPGARACRPRSAGARGSCTPPGSTTRAATRTACSCRSPAR